MVWTTNGTPNIDEVLPCSPYETSPCPHSAVGSEDSKDSCILVTHSNLIKVTLAAIDTNHLVSWAMAKQDLVGCPTFPTGYGNLTWIIHDLSSTSLLGIAGSP